MKLTGLTISFTLAGLGYSAALPILDNVKGTVAGTTDAATGMIKPVISIAGGPTGALKCDNTAAAGETIKTIPGLANSAVGMAGSAAGTAEDAVVGAGLPAKRQLNDLADSTLESAIPAIPAIIHEGESGDQPGALKREKIATLGETADTIPNHANSDIAIAGSAASTGESLVSGAASNAENAASH